ncbi:GAF domain-containing protein [Paenibacillus allorhizosphaerae]|nr:GAF domain-containing protein [Paenibacillus allorhizosphaerae]
MPLITQKITNELERLCHKTSSHFAALSLALPNEQRFRWLYAYGNRSERYKRMAVKPGAGPDGLSLRTGKPVLWNEQTDHSGRVMYECPLLTAEKLKTAAVMPLNEVTGLLFIARRTSEAYTNRELICLQEQLPYLSEILISS